MLVRAPRRPRLRFKSLILLQIVGALGCGPASLDDEERDDEPLPGATTPGVPGTGAPAGGTTGAARDAGPAASDGPSAPPAGTTTAYRPPPVVISEIMYHAVLD